MSTVARSDQFVWLLYDGTFEGLLSCIFEVYARKFGQVRIAEEKNYQADVFATSFSISTEEEKAARVWQGLAKKLSAEWHENIYKCFLSELPEREELILSFVQEVYSFKGNIEEHYAHPAVLRIAQIGRQLFREKHRFEAFVRFQQGEDGMYFSVIEPDFNILPLIAAHFQRRYADQQWVIYDRRRGYGIWYDLNTVQEVQFDEVPGTHQALLSQTRNTKEEGFQQAWQAYFKATTIQERKNRKLHLKHFPLRYWKYLTEKQPK